jgi:hypothetical protein
MIRSLAPLGQLGGVAIFIAALLPAAVASADPPASATFGGAPASLFLGRAMPDALLVGSFGGGVSQLGRSPHGWFLGVETGWARWLASDTAVGRVAGGQTGAADDGWAFGVRGGYQLRSGLAMQLRFDDLGVAVAPGAGSLAIASGGLRYAVPFAIMPFADVLVGAMFGGVDTAPAAALGVGVSVPVARHAALDLTARDWIADLGGSVRHIPSVMAGVNIGFGG